MAEATVQPSHTRRARGELQQRIQDATELPMALLGLVMLGLLIAELSMSLTPPWTDWVVQAQIAVWAVFALDFGVQFALAPSKLHYLRRNWIVAVAVALPALRVLRIARALRVLRSVRALRGVTLVRVLTGVNRAGRATADFLQSYLFAYVVALSVLVTLAAGTAAYSFERGHPDANIETFGDALWWAVTIITTVNSPLETVTLEGRIVALLIRLYGLAVIGYVTATIAVMLLGRGGKETQPGAGELEKLRREVERLSRLVEESARSRR